MATLMSRPRLGALTLRSLRTTAQAVRPPGVAYKLGQRQNSTVQSDILDRALLYVPEYGFTQAALARGAQEAGYLDVTSNVFPNGPFHLVNRHLVKTRSALQDVNLTNDGIHMGIGQSIKTLCRARLQANEAIAHRLQEALALMALPSNTSTSLAELARLADEIWYLAGDRSVDSSWYTKRASLSAVYSSTELFMSQDTSADFQETYAFLDRRLEDVAAVGGVVRDVEEWVGFTAHAFINVLRSKGVRI